MNDAKSKDALNEVFVELCRQDKKWGEQNHPDGVGEGIYYGRRTTWLRESDAEARVERAAKRGTLTYALIFLEEVAEALAARTAKHLRTELVQVAAVCVAWVLKIDRALARAAERKGMP